MTNTFSAMPKYERYRDSGFEWLKEVPEHWKLKPLRRVSKVHSGNGFPIEFQGNEDGVVPFIKVSDFSGMNRFINSANNLVTEKNILHKRWNKVPAGSLVTAKIGEALRKNHRNLLGCDAIIDNNCIGFEPMAINQLFFFYLNKIIDFDWFVNPGAVPSISVQKYRSWKVAIPTSKEQEAIANFLDEKMAQIDDAIGIKVQQIALLKERKKIIIQNAVTKGLNPNTSMKPSGVEWIGDIPANWDVKRLKYITKIVKRIIGHEGPDVLSITQNGIKVKDIESGEGQLAADYSNYQIVEAGDFAMNHMDLVTGYVDISKYDGVTSPDYRVFKNTSPDLDDQYLLLLFQMGYKMKIFFKYGQGVHTLRRWRFPAEAFNNFFIPIPSRDEQKEINEAIKYESEKIETGISVQLAQIENLKEYKASLINSAVTGKIKVV